MCEAHYSWMQVMTLKATSQGTFWDDFIWNCIIFSQIKYEIVWYTLEFLFIKFFSSKTFKNPCFQLLQNVWGTNEIRLYD